ncbi:CHAT domain-containing protein [Dactylosporangium sp. CA-139066]|uniref:CHAT domain-containing protein n=1 Tax=Dactylosporangium sp. CA-139066 TaxID=3239930 RepID=UPI003D914551
MLENCDDLGPDAPPHLIDAAIARLAAPADEGDLFCRASLLLFRHIQSTFMPDRTAAPDDLDRAVHDGMELLTRLRRDDAGVAQFEAAVRQVLAEALQLRDAPGDADGAIEVMAEATRRFPAGSPEWVMAVSGLGDRLFARYTTQHRPDDFAAAERAIRSALDAGSPDRPSLWMRLGSLFEERFRAEGAVADHRRALETLRTGWAEGSRYPMLAVSYADAVVNSGAEPTPDELDTAIALLSAIDGADLPAMVEPQVQYLVTVAHFRRLNARHDPADLRATVAAAGRVIDHPGTEPLLRAETRWIRATARLDHAARTGERMADIDPIIADLTAAVGLLKPAQRRYADTQLTRMLAERARRTGDERDAAAAEEQATQALQWMPEGSAERAEILYHLAVFALGRSERGRADPAAVDRAIGLLRQVVADAAATPTVRATAAGQLATATAGRAYYRGGDPTAVDAAITLAAGALRATSLGDMNRVALAASVAGALLVRYETRGDLTDLRWCLELLQDARDEAPGDPNRRELILTLAQAQIMWSQAAGEAPPAQTLAVLSDVLSAPPGDPRRVQALRSLAGGYAMRAERTDDPGDWRQAVGYTRQLLAGLAPGAPFTALMRMSAGGTLMLAGRGLNDIGLVREGTELTGAALDEPAGRLLRGRYLAAYGAALLELHRHAPRPGDLDRAVAALREANDAAAAEPGQRGAAEIGLGLAAALALAGDSVAAADAGRAALRARAWQVLLQSGTHDAMTAAGRSAADALQVARAALDAGDRPGAWLALETGRGLVLHAATVAATVPELLRGAGEPGLAERWNAAAVDPDGGRWRTADPDLPRDDRFRALEILARESALFDPPSLEAVGDALAAVGADALVYLFPGTDGGPGLALVVDPDGRVDPLDLPGLTGDWAVPEAVQQAVATREVEPVPDDSALGRGLADVCRAAWDVAIRPLLDRWHERHPGEPHLVLVPGGALATVPWHAAHGGGRWAIDEAAFSYIASGRLLVEVARRAAPPRGDVGLIIGNPDTGRPREALPNAGAEASAIFRAHYAAGRYCGRPDGPALTADGPGRPQDVLEWLAAAGSPPATVLHLACHGVVRADGPASSYLLLAGGARICAEEILRAAAARPAGRSPGLVSLAACTTHRAGRAYDEAVTLSTAFLVAGATTAIGSLWPVPDRETARLMVAFHDNLAGRGMPPRTALREAQRAMRDAADDATLGHWAGFVHLGQ